MPDAFDRALALRALERKVKHDRRTWDASGFGGSDATSPMDGRRSGRTGPPPSPVGGTAPYAITVTFEGEVPGEES